MPSPMPDDHLSQRPRAKTIAAENPSHDSAVKATRGKHAIETIDWLAIWALSIGFCAAFMAGIIALALLVSKAPRDEG